MCLLLPPFAHVLHATLRCVRVWLEVTFMALESMNDSAPVFSMLLVVGHGLAGTVDEDICDVGGAIEIYMGATTRLELKRRVTNRAHLTAGQVQPALFMLCKVVLPQNRSQAASWQTTTLSRARLNFD